MRREPCGAAGGDAVALRAAIEHGDAQDAGRIGGFNARKRAVWTGEDQVGLGEKTEADIGDFGGHAFPAETVIGLGLLRDEMCLAAGEGVRPVDSEDVLEERADADIAKVEGVRIYDQNGVEASPREEAANFRAEGAGTHKRNARGGPGGDLRCQNI